MRFQLRSGDWISIRCGRTCRMTRLMSRRNSWLTASSPSRYPRKRTSVTPRTAPAARCSACRMAGISDRGTSGVEAAGVAVGDEAVGDRDAGVRPGLDRAAGPEIDVVRVGHHDQDPLDRRAVEVVGEGGGGVGHGRSVAGRERVA